MHLLETMKNIYSFIEVKYTLNFSKQNYINTVNTPKEVKIIMKTDNQFIKCLMLTIFHVSKI